MLSAPSLWEIFIPMYWSSNQFFCDCVMVRLSFPNISNIWIQRKPLFNRYFSHSTSVFNSVQKSSLHNSLANCKCPHDGHSYNSPLGDRYPILIILNSLKSTSNTELTLNSIYIKRNIFFFFNLCLRYLCKHFKR